MNFSNSLDYAKQMDEADPLKTFREKFYMPQYQGKDKIYFTGNSLGLQPKSAASYLAQEMEDWAMMGGEGHFEARRPWYPYHEIFSRQLSAIIGCLPEEVVVMNSLTVNLHLLLVSFYQPTKKRFKIICEYKAFPSDQYVFESQARFHGFDPEEAVIEVKPRAGEHVIKESDILETIREHGESVAVVLLSGLNYYTGQVFNIKNITEQAHAVGAFAGFDLAHSIGNVRLELHEWKVDFACWCTYKYLNSGPGSVGGAYIHRSHASSIGIPRFAGWWGHDKNTRFKMEKGFIPMTTAEGWQLSNAPVFSMAMHKASLDIFEEAGMNELIKKGQALGDYLVYILRSINKELGEELIQLITPLDQKGCQVSMMFNRSGRDIYQYLMENGVSAGWREPAVLRVAPVPLYNNFEDVFHFGQIVNQRIKTSLSS